MSIGGRQLYLYANNDAALYKQRMVIAKNLAKKKARGNYDRTSSLIAWGHLANAASKSYAKEHGDRGDTWHSLFTSDDRGYAAKEWRDWWTGEQRVGAFESLLPAKDQKASTRKGTADAFRKLGQKAGAALRRVKRAVAPKKKAKKKGSKRAVTLPTMGNKKHFEHGDKILVVTKTKSTRYEGPGRPVSTTYYVIWIAGEIGNVIVEKADKARGLVRKFHRTGKLKGAS